MRFLFDRLLSIHADLIVYLYQSLKKSSIACVVVDIPLKNNSVKNKKMIYNNEVLFIDKYERRNMFIWHGI